MDLVQKINLKDLLSKKMFDKQNRILADYLLEYTQSVGYRLGSRDIAYNIEGEGGITKDQIFKVVNKVADFVKTGLLPIDFVDEDPTRTFYGVDNVDALTLKDRFRNDLHWAKLTPDDYNLDWWENETYYIQMVVEKKGLKTIFKDITRKYHIPIANSSGWGSVLMRGEYAQRFKKAEEKGLIPVLLYFGDFDPDGIRISNKLKSNLADLKYIYWNNGDTGYDPTNLKIIRFGLNRETIDQNDLLWVDNLITAKGNHVAEIVDGKIVAGKIYNKNLKKYIDHPNFILPYMQKYLSENGVRKVEANAVIRNIKMAQQLCVDAIEDLLGVDAVARFQKKTDDLKPDFNKWLEDKGYDEYLDEMINNTDD